MSNAEIRGLFVWHELMTSDPRAAADFYSKFLPWDTQGSSVSGYTLWMSGPIGVAGLMTLPQEIDQVGTPPSWLVYLATPDVDQTVQAAQSLGGRLLKPATDIPGIGRFAVLSDPQGAAFAVFTPAMPAPEGTSVAPHFSWHELATIDPQGALAFYSQLFGWTRGPSHDMGAGGLYQIIEQAGVEIGGLYGLQDPSKPPHWLTYVQVANLEEAVAQVRAGGGRVVREPHVVPGGSRVAHIVDPQGGAIALHEPRRFASGAVRKRRAPRRKSAAVRPRAAKRSAAKPKTFRKRTVKGSAAKSKTARKHAVKRAAKRSAAKSKTARKSARRTTARRSVAQGAARRTSKRKARAGAKSRKPARAKTSGKAARKAHSVGSARRRGRTTRR